MGDILTQSTEVVLVTLASLLLPFALSMWGSVLQKLPPLIQLALEFVIIAIPQTLIIVFPEYTWCLYAGVALIAASGYALQRLRHQEGKAQTLLSSEKRGHDVEGGKPIKMHPSGRSKRNGIISSYQTGLMITTVAAICAVDFGFFPVRFRKTTSYGISLMDVGVGLILFASGLVVCKYLKTEHKFTPSRAFFGSLPLLILGFVRAACQHFGIGAAEYGSHWNFFFNLALSPFALLAANCLPSVHAVPVAVFLVMAAYQCLLSFTGFSEYILKSDTQNLFTANKIGIFSAIGFASIFLMGCYASKAFALRKTNTRKSMLILGSTSALLMAAFFALAPIAPPSRKLANLTYVIWTLANGSLHTFLLVILGIVINEADQFLAFSDMISAHRLEVFVLANCLCGVIGFYFHPAHVPLLKGCLILLAYISINCAFAAVLYTNRIKLL